MLTKPSCILLIDDDKATNFINRRTLQDFGFTGHLQFCEDGQSGFDYLVKENEYADRKEPDPQIVILDINMPGIDGWDFLEQCSERANLRQNNTLFVLLTTLLDKGFEEKSKTYGLPVEFHLKPLSQDSLASIFERYGNMQ